MTIGATVIGAVAAIGGLWAQAWTGYYAGQVSKDQLRQARAEEQRERRAQANLVTFWLEGELYEGDRDIHIVNRSPDAITNVTLAVSWLGTPGETAPQFHLDLFYIQPCVEIIYMARDLELVWWGEPGKKERRERLDHVSWNINGLYFFDREGRRWDRGSNYLTEIDGYVSDPLLEGGVEPLKLRRPKVLKGADGPCAIG